MIPLTSFFNFWWQGNRSRQDQVGLARHEMVKTNMSDLPYFRQGSQVGLGFPALVAPIRLRLEAKSDGKTVLIHPCSLPDPFEPLGEW